MIRLLPAGFQSRQVGSRHGPFETRRKIGSTLMGGTETIRNHAAFIWSVADLLRGDYKQSEYGKVVLPLTVIRRLDCVLEPTKQAVMERYERFKDQIENID